ncbi:MAG: NUDIX hydrolase [Anaerolineaceae bacterium]|nr:MAG: NUDIX hydrolase [Anaerolineaceae bacterium]
MDSFAMYIALMKERPELFRNTGEKGEIKIILEPERILAEQRRIREELRAEGNPEHWIDIGVLSEDEWFWTVRDMVEFPDGHIWGYIRDINRKNQDGGFGVVLLCIRNNEVLVIKKFRHDERCFMLEFPRGFGDPTKTAEENARNELREETSAKEARLELLTEVREGKGGTSVYVARLLPDQEIIVDHREGIGGYDWFSFSELDELVLQGKLTDHYSLWAYTLAKAKKII